MLNKKTGFFAFTVVLLALFYQLYLKDHTILAKLQRQDFMGARIAVVNPSFGDKTRLETIRALSNVGVIDTEWQYFDDEKLRASLPVLTLLYKKHRLIAPVMLVEAHQQGQLEPQQLDLMQARLTRHFNQENIPAYVQLFSQHAAAKWLFFIQVERQLQAYHYHPRHRETHRFPNFLLQFYDSIEKRLPYAHLPVEEFAQLNTLRADPILLFLLKRAIQVTSYTIENSEQEKWLQVHPQPQSDVLLKLIHHYLNATDAAAEYFPNKKLFYNTEVRQLYMRKQYKKLDKYIPRVPMHGNVNSPLREYLGYVIGKALQVNVANTIIEKPYAIYSQLSVTMDKQTLPLLDIQKAMSAGFVFNVFTRKPDDGKTLRNRAPAGDTLVFFDHDGCFNATYLDFNEFLNAIEIFIDMDYLTEGQTLTKVDFDQETMAHVVERVQQLDIAHLIQEIEPHIIANVEFEVADIRQQLDEIQKMLLSTQRTIEQDVKSVYDFIVEREGTEAYRSE